MNSEELHSDIKSILSPAIEKVAGYYNEKSLKIAKPKGVGKTIEPENSGVTPKIYNDSIIELEKNIKNLL